VDYPRFPTIDGMYHASQKFLLGFFHNLKQPESIFVIFGTQYRECGTVWHRYADVRAVGSTQLRPRGDPRLVLQQAASTQEHHQETENSRVMWMMMMMMMGAPWAARFVVLLFSVLITDRQPPDHVQRPTAAWTAASVGWDSTFWL